MRNLSTLALQVYKTPHVSWDAVAADTESDDAAYVLHMEQKSDEHAQLLIARLSDAGSEELAAL